MKVREFFENKRNVKILIGIVSVLILIGICVFFWLIYTKDEPEFVPEETKGKIRKGIEEGIGENVKKVWGDGGQAIIDASYDNSESPESAANGSALPLSKIYTNKDLGFSLKYPSDFIVEDGSVVRIGKKDDTESGLYIYSYSGTSTPEAWWNQEKSKYSSLYSVESFNGGIKVTEEGGFNETHYIFQTGNSIVDLLSIGNTEANLKIVKTINF